MSFQVTVLKVLAGHPGGRASLAELKRAVAILISSGPDWTDRTKRMAERAAGLDIFSQSFVLRDSEGWQITEAGRKLLSSIENPVQLDSGVHCETLAVDAVATPQLLPTFSPKRQIAADRKGRRRRVRNRMRSHAVA